MFVLATVDVAISWNLLLRHTRWLYTEDIHCVIADVLLILRCYVVWGRRKSILILTGLLLVVGTVFGIISEGTLSPSLKKFIIVYLCFDLVLNVGVTILTAGRILWIAREVKKIVGDQMTSHYHFAIGLMAAVISIRIVVGVIFFAPPSVILTANLQCIVPILLIVQITLGQSVKDVQSTVNKLQGGTQQIVLDTIVSTHIEFERGAAHEGLDAEEVDNTQQPGDSESCSVTNSSDN
ncbi:hypothetical protein CPB84DRAFT_1777961 [Gymnopilus junonius]|uniref:Transmembrane protein n=1 Tax=Gymnopilus junonius TaxID=109634 RepID=A0A9P5NQB8_GYMJU|nr:hypothetical protein CPB84DRAFT_1777961 [Gymnopilus junonius]